ncbi:MAG: DMT family transporter [Pseudomonadota bacterium]
MTRIFAGVFVSMSFIVLGDTAGKALTAQGVAPVFVAWTRFAIAAVLLLPVSGLTRNEMGGLFNWRLWLRAGLICGGIASILTALKTVPIADVYGAFFVGPSVAFLLSALVLREQVTWLRGILLACGFVGVLLVVQPGLNAPPGVGFAVLAGIFYGAYLTATRWLAPAYRPRFLLISQLVIGAILLAPFGASAPLPPLTPSLSALVVASALASAAGNYLLVMISRTTPASVVSPLVYTQLIAATAAGYVFFGDLPDPVALTGLAIILASGLGSLRLARI